LCYFRSASLFQFKSLPQSNRLRFPQRLMQGSSLLCSPLADSPPGPVHLRTNTCKGPPPLASFFTGAVSPLSSCFPSRPPQKEDLPCFFPYIPLSAPQLHPPLLVFFFEIVSPNFPYPHWSFPRSLPLDFFRPFFASWCIRNSLLRGFC